MPLWKYSIQPYWPSSPTSRQTEWIRISSVNNKNLFTQKFYQGQSNSQIVCFCYFMKKYVGRYPRTYKHITNGCLNVLLPDWNAFFIKWVLESIHDFWGLLLLLWALHTMHTMQCINITSWTNSSKPLGKFMIFCFILNARILWHSGLKIYFYFL